MAKCQIDSFRLRRTGSMCHMFLLNVEFGNSFGFSSVTFRPSRVFHSRVFSRPVLTQTNRVLEVARIFTQHSKCCDECFVLTMSLYAFISLLYKQLLKYTQLKSFTVPSALLIKFAKKVLYENYCISFRFHKIVHENTLLWRRHVSFEYRGLSQNTPASFFLFL